MDARSREVRQTLRDMAPSLSIPIIRRCQLPEEEEAAVIEIDVRRHSVQQVAMAAHVSEETVKRRRKAALRKLSGVTLF